ncbi:MAG: AAA-like domain-containing protein [Candidatus Schekmanbacteria bacterium]|nr:AAA-like domain-containing protein [Candidatus Schekmanbacteria bacterium]
MRRFFNTAGPCRPDMHYMLPPERRIPEVRELIDRAQYFVVHAPRQVGKTTCLATLAATLTAEGRYAALLASCEAAQPAGGDIQWGVDAIVSSIDRRAQLLPPDLRPPGLDESTGVHPGSRLNRHLSSWAQQCPHPVVLFLDEIDALQNETLISVLRQLRDGYQDRPSMFPQSVALIGLRDVRDYKVRVRTDRDSLGTSSPFNVKVRSLTIADFTATEVAELLGQHTAQTGQRFTEEAMARVFELTRGQPWLVNALAAELVDKQVPDRTVAILPEHVEAAREVLIERRDTHLDSLVERLREERVRRIV